VRRRLLDELRRARPDLDDAEEAIAAGRVFVNGSPVTNPSSMVTPGASVVVRPRTELRGSRKLAAALDALTVDPAARTCLDVGAAAGGFTTTLLDRGASRVYAVDVGHGQLRGSLRQDARVVNLESTNVADLDRHLVPDPISLVTVDVSYLSLTAAVAQLDRLEIEPGAELVGLVKPMFELRLSDAPTDAEGVRRALEEARRGVEAAGWEVRAAIASPVPGARGAMEGWVHATRD